MGVFDFPSRCVYVEFSDGTKENVACDNSLTKSEADWFCDYWTRKGNVKAVMLMDGTQELKRFEY